MSVIMIATRAEELLALRAWGIFGGAVAAARAAVSPSTLMLSNLGMPPPLFAIASRSDRMVRTFTSGGGGGALGADWFTGENGDEVK